MLCDSEEAFKKLAMTGDALSWNTGLELDSLDIGIVLLLTIFVISLVLVYFCAETCEDCCYDPLKIFLWVFLGCGIVLGLLGYCLLQRPPEVSFIQCVVSNPLTLSIKSAIIAYPFLYVFFLGVVLLTVASTFVYLRHECESLGFIFCIFFLFVVAATVFILYGYLSMGLDTLSVSAPLPPDHNCGNACDADLDESYQNGNILSSVESGDTPTSPPIVNRLPSSSPSSATSSNISPIPSKLSSQASPSANHFPQPTSQPCIKIHRDRRNELKWRDIMILHYSENREEKILRIMSKIAVKWRELARMFDFDERLIAENHNNGVEFSSKCCHDVLYKWFQKGSSRYPVTWNGFICALRDIELYELVKDIEIALKCVIQ